jgi:hypothetical protein
VEALKPAALKFSLIFDCYVVLLPGLPMTLALARSNMLFRESRNEKYGQ